MLPGYTMVLSMVLPEKSVADLGPGGRGHRQHVGDRREDVGIGHLPGDHVEAAVFERAPTVSTSAAAPAGHRGDPGALRPIRRDENLERHGQAPPRAGRTVTKVATGSGLVPIAARVGRSRRLKDHGGPTREILQNRGDSRPGSPFAQEFNLDTVSESVVGLTGAPTEAGTEIVLSDHVEPDA